MEEISSVCLHSPPLDVNLAIFNDDELDEDTANLIELHFAALIEQHNRQQQYKSSPSASLQADIIRHKQYIQFAGSLLDPMYQPVLDRFQLLLNAADANGSTATSTVNFNSVLMDAESPSEFQLLPHLRVDEVAGAEYDFYHNSSTTNETNIDTNNTAQQNSTAKPMIASFNFSPRDRDIDAIPPLGDRLVSDLAGQASAARTESHNELTTWQHEKLEVQPNQNETNIDTNNTAQQNSTAKPMIARFNFSPRDRDIDAIPPLVVGLVSDLAGQANAARTESNNELTTWQHEKLEMIASFNFNPLTATSTPYHP